MGYVKRAEMVSGIGTVAVGLLGIIGALVLPVRSQSVTVNQHGHVVGFQQQGIWLLQEMGTARAAGVLATLGVLAAVVALASLLHVSQRLTIDLIALWGSALLLVFAVSVSITWTSYLFLPTAFLAVVVAVLATLYQLLPTRRTPEAPPDGEN